MSFLKFQNFRAEKDGSFSADLLLGKTKVAQVEDSNRGFGIFFMTKNDSWIKDKFLPYVKRSVVSKYPQFEGTFAKMSGDKLIEEVVRQMADEEIWKLEEGKA